MVSSDFTRPERAILILLKAEDKKNTQYASIPGNIHLDKELFAVWKTELGKKLLPDLNFEPDNFGPYDETIFAVLKGLVDAQFVSVEPSRSGNKMSLTDTGKKAADELWAELEARNRYDILDLFTYVKRNLNHLSSDRLLEKIYTAHPEMLDNSISKIADKIRAKEPLNV
jgi:hypothetical protein